MGGGGRRMVPRPSPTTLGYDRDRVFDRLGSRHDACGLLLQSRRRPPVRLAGEPAPAQAVPREHDGLGPRPAPRPRAVRGRVDARAPARLLEPPRERGHVQERSRPPPHAAGPAARHGASRRAQRRRGRRERARLRVARGRAHARSRRARPHVRALADARVRRGAPRGMDAGARARARPRPAPGRFPPAGGSPRLTSMPTSLLRELETIVGPAGLVSSLEERRTYESDGLPGYKVTPGLVVLPETAEQVSRVVRLCHERRVPFVARGSGTGLSGGALPVAEGVLIVLSRMRRIVEVDLDNQRVVLEPGVTNLAVTQRVAADGYYYAPDPSSQVVCSIGGNVAGSSGGAHCLKHGFTAYHGVGLEVVLPDGEVVSIGGKVPDAPGYHLVGAFVGSEGTLGIATRITLRLLRRPETVKSLLAAFASTDEAGEAVSRTIAAGILPAAIEMMDALAITAAEAAVQAGYPAGAGAVLIVELDGPAAEVD